MRHFSLLIASLLATCALYAQSSDNTFYLNKVDTSLPAPDRVINLWEDVAAPHTPDIAEQPIYSGGILTHNADAVLYIFEADKERATGEAVVICPGGAYYVLCMSYEGVEMAAWLAEQGITAAVVQYRMPRGEKEVPLDDTTEALRRMRELADEIGYKADRVGIMGYSAGGHLAAYTSCMSAERPDFAVLFYPVITMLPPYTHEGSAENLLGKSPSVELRERYSMEQRVTSKTPPTIIFHSDKDDLVPTQNVTAYYEALRREGVAASLNIYPDGYHGWGIREDFEWREAWQQTLLQWLAATFNREQRELKAERRATPADKIFRTRPYLQNPIEGGMTVMWQTTIPTYSWVEYGIDTLHLERARLLIDGQAEFSQRIHKIRLEGLDEGERYYYRVCSQEILHYGAYHKEFGTLAKSPFYSFTTPKADTESFTAIIFNDLHQNEEVFEELYSQVKDVERDFVIFNGDCIDDPKSEEQATYFISLLTERVGGERVPTIFIRGNHEIRDAYSVGLRQHFDYIGGRTYGAFSWGDSRFVILDCGEDKPDATEVYYDMNDFTQLREEQVAFLREELGSKRFKRAERRILLHHIPIYGMLGRNLCEELWRPLLDGAKFDVALNAHTHRFAYHPRGSSENNYPVIVGGGRSHNDATVMILRKEGKELSVKVLNAEGKTLLEEQF